MKKPEQLADARASAPHGPGSGDPATSAQSSLPSSSSSSPSVLSPAEELLIEFLGRHSIDDCAAFDALCSEQSAIASELRELHADWARLDRVLGMNGGHRNEPEATPDPRQASRLASKRESPAISAALSPAWPATSSPRVTPPGSSPASSPASSPGAPPATPLAAPRADGSKPEQVPTGFDDVLARLASHSALESRYVIEEELARGGMGVVFKAWDADLRRHVAMKVLRDKRLSLVAGAPLERERMLARFLEEAQITGQLDHPGVVPVHEIGLDADGRVFFTMPLVRGRELREIFKLARRGAEGWSIARVLAVFVKVCEAVAYAHSKGVVHRDIKPSNVMVGAFGEAYVMDWGLARVVERLRGASDVAGPSAWVETDVRARIDSTPGSPLATRDGAVIGTPAYMAPEQANGRVQDIGPSCDVYAIGAMLYQLLTGTMPYADSTSRLTPQALIAARLSRPPTPIDELAPDTAPELAAICRKAMAESPTQRYATALELSDDLEAFLGRRPVRAFDSSLPYLVRLAIQRNRKTAAAIGVGLLASAALVARDVVKSRSVAAREARHSATLADANRRLQRDADSVQAKLLLQEEGTLRVASRDELGELRSWLARSEGVLDRAVERRSNAAFGALLEDSREELELCAQLSAAIGRVRERAGRVEAREHADRELWESAIRDIAASPLYGGLGLTPQWGLAPLQRNPSSGLWEFWVVESGEAPRIVDAASGRLELTEASALVLVLVPGGRARLGSARNDLGRNLLFPARDGRGRTDNEDERFVELAPYFVGKTEVSQSVWRRVMGANPAHFSDSEACAYEPWSGLLPVESVSWNDAQSFAEKLGLTLPFEAQWEYAARCGRSAPFAFGSSDNLAELLGQENLNDRLGSEQAPASIGLLSECWCDGYWSVSPVMSFAPNAWGLHDMLGNVSELCADVYEATPFGADVLGLDGAQLASKGRYRSFRGASFATPRAEAVRVAFRQWDRPTTANHGRGVRVARPLR